MPVCQRAKRTLRLPAVAALLACLVPLLSACQGGEGDEPLEVRPVRAVTIADRVENGMVSLTGTVQAQAEINQSFRIDGRVVQRFVDVGDTVAPGQVLAQLDPQNEQSALAAARAQLTAAQAQLIEAENNNARMTELVAEGAVSRAAFDQAVAMLQTARSQVESAQAQLELAENRLGYTQLVSDVAGVVTARGAEPGEVVGAGRMIVQVAREDARDAVFGVSARVKEGAPGAPEITVELTSDPDVRALGSVREVAPRADPVTGTFEVRVGLKDPPAAMRLGSTVTGRMQVASGVGIELPSSALTRADGRPAVWVVDPEALTVSLRAVEVQARNPDSVEVAAGLSQGEVVVTAGVHALRPGQKVRLLEQGQP